jgi:hypothetical protein
MFPSSTQYRSLQLWQASLVMHDEVTLLDEDFPARLCASFPDRLAAREAADRLETMAGSEQVQIQIMSPQDGEADAYAVRGARGSASGGGRRRILRAGAVGLACGICLGFLYLVMSPVAADRAAGVLLFIAVFGALAGLLLAALLGWRSTRGIPHPRSSQASPQGGGWQVVVTAHDLAQHYEARRILAATGGTNIRPF